MRIQQLKLENFRGFEELKIDFPEKGSAVFIGVNGAGKSSVLEAIGIVLKTLFRNVTSGIVPLEPSVYLENDDIRHNKVTLSIEASLNYFKNEFDYPVTFPIPLPEDDFINVIHYIKHIHVHHDLYPFFTFFQSNRTMKKIGQDESNLNDTFKITSFENFIIWFEARENFENQQKLELQDFNYTDKHLSTVRTGLLTFLSEIPDVQFSNLKMKRYERIESQIGYKSDVNSFLSIVKNDKVFKISQLSDGEKMTIMMVCDIIRQLSLTNPNLKYPLESEGIVLIDEIDLHLHPSWQRAIIPALEKTFPNIQFIVTTHSPQVLSTVKKENVFILEDFKLIKETPNTFGQDSNSILYNIFGINERPEQAANDFKKIYRLIDEEKLTEAKKMLEEMSEKYGYYDSEIVRAKMHLDFNHH